MSNAEKLSWSDIRDVLVSYCKTTDKEKVVVSPANMTYLLNKMKDIQVTNRTIRGNGFGPGGYWDLNYSSASYKSTGQNKDRGLVIQVDDFLEEVEE